MKIRGIPAVEANRLEPDQWVNVWQFNIWGKLEFYADCQVRYLNQYVDFDEHDIDDFVLEPTTKDGNPIDFKGAE